MRIVEEEVKQVSAKRLSRWILKELEQNPSDELLFRSGEIILFEEGEEREVQLVVTQKGIDVHKAIVDYVYAQHCKHKEWDSSDFVCWLIQEKYVLPLEATLVRLGEYGFDNRFDVPEYGESGIAGKIGAMFYDEKSRKTGYRKQRME